MKRWIPVLIIFLLAAGGIWFWSLGDVPEPVPGAAQVTEVRGRAWVRHTGSDLETPAEPGTRLAEGDVVRTERDSSATVEVTDISETRLGADTELLIQAVELEDRDAPFVRVRLETGRIWSRVLRMLDFDAEFTAETSDVVATVRGTSFDLEKQASSTALTVAESVVEAFRPAAGAEGTLLADGQTQYFVQGMASGTPARLGVRTDPWIVANRERDKAFRVQAARKLAEQVGVRAAGSGVLSGLVRGSEALRERTSPDEKKKRLSEGVLMRRFAEIRRDIDAGNVGQASRELVRLQGELERRLANDGEDVATVRLVVRRSIRLFQDIPPSSDAYRLKQQIEDFIVKTAESSEAALAARLLAIDARLDETVWAMDEGRYDEAGQTLELAARSLSNVERETSGQKNAPTQKGGAKKESKQERRPVTADKFQHILSVRIETLRDLLKETQEPPERVMPSDLPPASATPTTPVLPTSTTAVPASSVPRSLQITPGSVKLDAFQSLSFQAVLVMSDGGTKTVTKAAVWSISDPRLGVLQGNLLRAGQDAGTLAVRATYSEAGSTFTAEASVTIKP